MYFAQISFTPLLFDSIVSASATFRFSGWLQMQQFESHTRLMSLALWKTEKYSEGYTFANFFDALEHKQLWELGTEQMPQTFQMAKEIQLLGNADLLVLNIFHRVFDNLGTPLSSILSWAHLPLAFNAGARKRKEGTIAGALQTPSPQEVLMFLPTVHFFNELQSSKEPTTCIKYKNSNRIALLMEPIMMVWKELREMGNLLS